MRLFIAVKASEEIFEFVKNVKPKIKAPVRWLPYENLHITLIPPFEANEKELTPIINKLENIKINQTKLFFTELSFGPNPKKPRLLWLTAEKNEILSLMKQEIEIFLEVPSVNRDFIPHITIARFKEEEFKSFAEKEQKIQTNIFMEITSFSLIQSTLTKDGAIYTTIKDFK